MPQVGWFFTATRYREMNPVETTLYARCTLTRSPVGGVRFPT